MSYAALLIIFIAIGLTSYYAFKKDLLSPTVITCCMFAFSVLLAIIGLSSWNKITELSPYTIGLMAVGVLAFFAGEILVRKFIKRKEGRPYKMHPIVVKRWKVIFSILFVAITLVLLYFEVKRICSYYGFDSNSLSELLAFYRTKSSLFSTALATDGTDINFIVKQMKKISDVICIIFMYIVANNILMGDKAKRIALYCIPIILSLIVTFFGSGGRSLMMHMIIGFFMMFLLLFRYKRQNKSIPKKYFAYLLLTAVATLLLFYLIAPLIGRGSRSNPLEYISFYLGTPIPSFEHFLSNIPSHRPYFGYETFSGIYTNLYKLGIVDTLEIGSHEWFAGSNVYTSFRSYYFDFGIIGVILCQFIFGACIAALYTNVKDLKHKGLFIIYGFFSYILIDQIRDEQFFSLLISSNVIYIILIILFYWLYVRSNIANADEYWNNKVKNPVIIIGGNHHNALGVIRSLGEKGIRPYAILTNDDKYAFVAKSKYLEGADIIREDETAIMNLLAEKYAGKDEKPILIPTSDFAAYCIDKNLNKLKKDFIVPSINGKQGEIIRLMDKYAQYNLATKKNITMARTHVIEVDKDVNVDNIPLPCFMKPIVSAFGSKDDMRICHKKQQVEKAVLELRRRGFSKVLVQEFIDYDCECGLIGLAKNGDIVLPGMVKKVRRYPVKYGVNSKSKIMSLDNYSADIAPIMDLLKTIGYNGLFDIDIFEKDGEIYLNEINFRNSGNQYAYNYSGVNLIYWYVMLCANQDTSYLPRKIPKEYYYCDEMLEVEQLRDHNISVSEYLKTMAECKAHFYLNIHDNGVMIYKLWYAIRRRVDKKVQKLHKNSEGARNHAE